MIGDKPAWRLITNQLTTYNDAVVGSAGGMSMAGLIAGVGFVACDHILAVTLLTVSWAFSGLIGVGPHISALDMSPQHAGRHHFSYASRSVSGA